MSVNSTQNITWFKACEKEEVPDNGGVCVKYGEEQIALFHFTRRNEWFASQNLCPHRQQMAISRGMIGSQGGEPKVACPFHKKTFSLIDGRCLTGDDTCGLKIYPVKLEGSQVYIGIHNDEALVEALA
ncbi:assimilatory nitrite reductase (NAD(P)H) small subunit [Filimonas lacunae]|uniref:Assimilatory nitrite reductase (NAD(P)H) small subunit n=1 Tax=Filimonas lacunae TaxID=477680 RepID=A0A173MJE3_9BACT|nr:nitrite reductase small subunit NirD [Filimonas lacunae]BAV07607.1 nitrite reductase [NAD(P)H] small subunit [Filimonas lacunae]SIT29804.1 assimilatory nitrite reductase (NAD(P)H) small subunit [Filimonas lacunae]